MPLKTNTVIYDFQDSQSPDNSRKQKQRLYFLIAPSTNQSFVRKQRQGNSRKNDGSDTINIADRTVTVSSPTFITPVTLTKSFGFNELIFSIAQPASSEFAQFPSAVKSQSQPVEPELEPFIDFVIEQCCPASPPSPFTAAADSTATVAIAFHKFTPSPAVERVAQ